MMKPVIDPGTERLYRLAARMTIVAGGLLMAGGMTDAKWLGWIGVGILCAAVGTWIASA